MLPSPMVGKESTRSGIDYLAAVGWVLTSLFQSGYKILIELRYRSGAWVDVRDVAQAHALAIEKDSIAGQRILLGVGMFKFQDYGELALLYVN